MLDHRPTPTKERVQPQRVRPSRGWMWTLAASVALATAGLIIASIVLIGGEETVAPTAYEYRALRPGSGFIEGLDGPVVPEPYEYRRIHTDSGFFAGLDPGPVTVTREYRRIEGGVFEGLDPGLVVMPLAPAAPAEYVRIGGGILEGTGGPAPASREYVRIGGGIQEY